MLVVTCVACGCTRSTTRGSIPSRYGACRSGSVRTCVASGYEGTGAACAMSIPESAKASTPSAPANHCAQRRRFFLRPSAETTVSGARSNEAESLVLTVVCAVGFLEYNGGDQLEHRRPGV